MVRRWQQGHVLMVALIVVLVVASAGAVLWVHYQLQARIALQQSRQVRLVALNDAAVAEALARLADNHGYRGEGPHDFGGGEISNEVRSIDSTQFEILATARYRGWERRTRLRVTMIVGSPRVDAWTLDRNR